MKDEIIIKKDKIRNDAELVPFEEVKIILIDQGRYSGKSLVNTYCYAIQNYDSLAYRLTLIDFKVELATPNDMKQIEGMSHDY